MGGSVEDDGEGVDGVGRELIVVVGPFAGPHGAVGGDSRGVTCHLSRQCHT